PLVSLLSINPCNTDFSDALGDRRIEEIQPPRFAGASPDPTHPATSGMQSICPDTGREDEMAELQIQIGRTYRAKKPRAVNCGVSQLINDRTVKYVGAFEVQYDGPSVRFGQHYPRIPIEKFLAWADRDVTDELPVGEYAEWPPSKAKA
ncbi:TPA: hypothetical protein ACGPOR_000588, partial [Pseudomonas aeruginosa]